MKREKTEERTHTYRRNSVDDNLNIKQDSNHHAVDRILIQMTFMYAEQFVFHIHTNTYLVQQRDDIMFRRLMRLLHGYDRVGDADDLRH